MTGLLRGIQMSVVVLAAMMTQVGAEALATSQSAAAMFLAALPLTLFALALYGRLGEKAALMSSLFGIIGATVIVPSLIMPEMWKIAESVANSSQSWTSVAPIAVIQAGLILAAAAMAQRASTQLAGRPA